MTGGCLLAKGEKDDFAAAYCCEDKYHAWEAYHPLDHDCFVGGESLVERVMVVYLDRP